MAQDILIGDDMDLIIENGDIKLGLSDYQHVNNLMLSNKGEYKQYPILGIGIQKYQNCIIDKTIEQEIKLQLEIDGVKQKDVKLNDNGIMILVNYD